MGLINLVFRKTINKRLASYQNELLVQHYNEVQNIYRQMRAWKHDYHNHIQTLKAHLALGQITEIETYLGKLDTDLSEIDMMIKTGNIMVDAILNSKLSLASSRGIRINVKATVPDQIQISEIDLCVVIGNLIDNAIEACLKLEEKKERFLRIYIGNFKGEFYISISNSTKGKMKKWGKTYLSTKNSESHGFGLMRVDQIIQKYHGYINRQNEEGVFATEIMLPFS